MQQTDNTEMSEILVSLEAYASTVSVTDEDTDFIKNLEDTVKQLRMVYNAKLNESLEKNGGEYSTDKYRFKRTDVMQKTFDPNIEPDERFIKTEKKVNTAIVNEYYKKNKELPLGITEIFKYSKVTRKDLEKEAINQQKSEEYKNARKEIEKQAGNLTDIKWKTRKSN